MTSLTIGLDTAKSVFHAVEKNANGGTLKKAKLTRSKLLSYFEQKPACTIAIEACGACHHWHRVFSKMGHSVVIIAPQYVAKHRVGNKNDFNDANALAEVVQKEDVRTVPPKSIEQQDVQLIHRIRERLIKQRTALSNQIRGFLAEYGIILPKGIRHIRQELPFVLEDSENELTPITRAQFHFLYEELKVLDEKIKSVDKEINTHSEANEQCKRLQTMPGIGPIVSTALWVALGDSKNFKNGRHFAAWCGLVPKQYTTGDNPRLLGISKRGNAYLRTQLINGARSALRHAKTKEDSVSQWVVKLEERVGFNKACVALANKMARMAWAMVHHLTVYKIKAV